MKAYKREVRKRLCDTNVKVYKVLALLYVEDMELYGRTYGDLLAYLDNMALKAAVSPLHDKDKFTADDVWKWCERHIDPDTGDLDIRYVERAPYVDMPKKAHCHLLLTLPRQATAAEFSEVMAGYMPIRESMWERCYNEQGALRYFAHLDSRDKAQYDKHEIHGFGGIDLSCIDKVTDLTMQEITSNIMHLIKNHDEIRYFYQLVDFIEEHGNADALGCLYGKHSLFNAQLRSKAEHRRDKLALEKAREQMKRDAARRADLIG